MAAGQALPEQVLAADVPCSDIRCNSGISRSITLKKWTGEATVLGDGVAVRSLPSWLDSGARANERHHREVVQNWQGALKLSEIVGRCLVRPVRRKPEAGDGTL